MKELIQAIRRYGEASSEAGQKYTSSEKTAARRVLELILKRKPTPEEVASLEVFSAVNVADVFGE